MSNDKMPKKHDLEERTEKCGEDTIEFAKKVPKNIVTIPLVSQLVRAGTSVGSNYCEADCAESRRDFERKLGICSKEVKETKHWLKMIAKAAPVLRLEALKLMKEANELDLIFITIIKNSRANAK